jgi:hypothetical protein
MTSRTAFRISLAAGMVILAFVVFSAAHPGPHVCGGLAPNYLPIIAFELARSVADLHAIFGDHPGACRTAIATAMDDTNWFDSLAFIPLYGSFLAFFFLGARDRAAGLARTGLLLTIIACEADQLENICLFHLSADPDTASVWLLRLMVATETKWVLLGMAGFIGGLILWRSGHWIARAAILPCAAGAAVTLISITNPTLAGPTMSLAISLGWIVFLLTDAVGAFGRRQ